MSLYTGIVTTFPWVACIPLIIIIIVGFDDVIGVYYFDVVSSVLEFTNVVIRVLVLTLLAYPYFKQILICLFFHVSNCGFDKGDVNKADSNLPSLPCQPLRVRQWER